MAKKPSVNRATLYAVVREQWSDHVEAASLENAAILGVYLSLARAEEVSGRYQQEMIDKGLGDFFEFSVRATTYYDE